MLKTVHVILDYVNSFAAICVLNEFFYHILADIEGILETTKEELIQNTNRSKAVNIIQNHMNSLEHQIQNTDPNTKLCMNAKKITTAFLKQHPEICVLASDKGNRTVIMNTEDYKRKMTHLVNDSRTYRKTKRDPTSGYQTKNNSFAKRFFDLNLIDKYKRKKLSISNATCPRIYGQPKAHKNELPLRPVIPNITAPTYQLAKFMANILRSSITSEYETKSSFEFCDDINGIKLPDNYIIISLDVVSLFTNIPRHLVISNLIEHWKEINTQINLDLFIEIIEFLMEASYFQFKNTYYVQTFGTAMGSPLSPILAQMVLDTIIGRALKALPFPIPIIRKYVDDLFLAIPKTDIQILLETFNKQEDRIQFTIEEEKEGKLPYLDMVVIRNQDQTLTTEWYTKPIASGRMLNFHSCHQLKHKINVANNFIGRVSYLTSNNHSQDIAQTIHSHLNRNNYPRTLINRLLNLHKKRHQTQSPKKQPSSSPPIAQNTDQPTITQNATTDITNQQTTDECTYRSIPYVPHLSDKLIKSFVKDFPSTKIATRQIITVGQLFSQVKDPKPNGEKTNIIYEIPCQNDCPCVYIGQTKNTLDQRLSGHKSNIKLIDQYIKKKRKTNGTNDQQHQHQHIITNAAPKEKDTTALIDHCLETGHRFNITQTKILDSSFNTHTLKFLEMCHIFNNPNTVNLKTDTNNLNAMYANILNNLKKHNYKTKSLPKIVKNTDSLPPTQTTDNNQTDTQLTNASNTSF
ncbi:uncharacterized protein LOC129752680 [Uranotaenia lowii]|uniref:uncharacterized protein LOC129752680 n=1 Tax=Uranotaenia lowii TaxID=190385 RepID=UPI002478EC14|nr:uncharacterized protein LOC129752680 [Uranotaenia lowii]